MALAVAAIPRLGFCEHKLCAIELNLEPTMNQGLGEVAARVYAALQAKYGSKSDGTPRVPRECHFGAFRDCIINGQARSDLNWRWKTGETVSMYAGSDRFGPKPVPGLYVFYGSTASPAETQGL